MSFNYRRASCSGIEWLDPGERKSGGLRLGVISFEPRSGRVKRSDVKPDLWCHHIDLPETPRKGTIDGCDFHTSTASSKVQIGNYFYLLRSHCATTTLQPLPQLNNERRFASSSVEPEPVPLVFSDLA